MEENVQQLAVVINANMPSDEIESMLNEKFIDGYTFNTNIKVSESNKRVERQIIILDKTYV